MTFLKDQHPTSTEYRTLNGAGGLTLSFPRIGPQHQDFMLILITDDPLLVVASCLLIRGENRKITFFNLFI